MPRKEHQWDFICRTPKGELSFCRLCDRWRYDFGRPFKMSKAEMKTLGPMVFFVAKEDRP